MRLKTVAKQEYRRRLDNFITIITFSHPVEFAVLQTRLEAEGIECRILDELAYK